MQNFVNKIAIMGFVPQVCLPVCNEGLVLDRDEKRVVMESDCALCSYRQRSKQNESETAKPAKVDFGCDAQNNVCHGYTTKNTGGCLEMFKFTSISTSTGRTAQAPDKQNVRHDKRQCRKLLTNKMYGTNVQPKKSFF